jgi:hypothetical protein
MAESRSLKITDLHQNIIHIPSCNGPLIPALWSEYRAHHTSSGYFTVYIKRYPTERFNSERRGHVQTTVYVALLCVREVPG